MNKWSINGMKPTRAGFGEGVAEAAGINPRVVALGADITASVGLDLFAKRFPERFYSLGIAEQNCVGVAAGMALSGKIPVFSTYAVFAAFRAADQLRVSVCYNQLHVVIGGAHAGISVGPDGATHQALEDLAVMRTLPGMTVLSPCDATQARLAAIAAVLEVDGPVYIRFGRESVPDFTNPQMEFIPGKAQLMLKGTEITLAATGHMVWEALQAAMQLHAEGIPARVVNFHTLKPLDDAAIALAARETGCILTVEEHQVNAGLGGAICEKVASLHPVPVHRIGMDDTFGESGQPGELMEKYGLNARNIYQKAMELVDNKFNAKYHE